jgi:hypothetical protein
MRDWAHRAVRHGLEESEVEFRFKRVPRTEQEERT